MSKLRVNSEMVTFILLGVWFGLRLALGLRLVLGHRPSFGFWHPHLANGCMNS